MMKIRDIKSIYPTITDPLTQNILKRISVDDILLEIKTQALFFDVISPSISHLLSSSLTYKAIEEEPELLKEGIIQPQIPTRINDANEYIEWMNVKDEIKWFERIGIKLTEKSYLTLYLNRNEPLKYRLISKNPYNELKKRIKFLNENTAKYWRYDQPYATNIAKHSIEKDLDIENSPFSDKFINKDNILSLKNLALKTISERGKLDRFLLFMYIDKLKVDSSIFLKKKS